MRMQEVKQACQPPITGGGFADLLQAVLTQQDPCSAFRTQKETAHALQPMDLTSKPRALGDVTNTQVHESASGRQGSVAAASKTCSAAPMGKTLTAAPVAAATGKAPRAATAAAATAPAARRNVAKPQASAAVPDDAARIDIKAGSRRSARVQARKLESKSDRKQQSGTSQAVELFSGTHQVNCLA